MKKIVLFLSLGVFLTGCNDTEQPEKVEKYSVEFLVKQENKEVLNTLIADCQAEVASGKEIKDVMGDPNCRNAEIATQQRQADFNSSGGERRKSTRAFAEPEGSEEAASDEDVNSEVAK